MLPEMVFWVSGLEEDVLGRLDISRWPNSGLAVWPYRLCFPRLSGSELVQLVSVNRVSSGLASKRLGAGDLPSSLVM